MNLKQIIKLNKKYVSFSSTLSVNTIRMLGVAAIDQAQSGHPGIVLGAAPIMYALFRNHLNVNPLDLNYFNRDRFVLSAGHGSALLYATMLVAGYPSITMTDLKQFRQLNSITAGHPEATLIKGIEASTGPLGQGVAMAVGMAIAETKLANKFNKYNKLIDHYTYALFGDGCLQEGVFYEAISVAGKLKLNKLILLYDSNDVQLDGCVSDSTNTNVKQLFNACGWNYLKVKNANDIYEISDAINKAKKSLLPTVIECKSIIGYGSPIANSNAVHGAPLKPDQLLKLRESLNYKEPLFTINQKVTADFNKLKIRAKEHERQYNIFLQEIEAQNINLYNEILALSNNNFAFEIDWFADFKLKTEAATRDLAGEVLQPLASHNSTLMIGSADLSGSTKIYLKDLKPFDKDYHAGQNLNYGVREFAMIAINNGIVAHGGCRAIGATFLAFSDYCKAAIRLAAIAKLPNISVFSHDSITVGEDGPTHQPIEQIWNLRLIPNHVLFRPANLIETKVAYEYAFKAKTQPVTIISSRGVFKQPVSNYEMALQGGYVIKDIKDHQLNLIATGSEVAVAIAVAEILNKKKIRTRVISMNSLEVFNEQPLAYQNMILDNKPKVSIEYGVTTPWYKYVDFAIGINTYGRSGKPEAVIDFFELNADKIAARIINWLPPLK